jgi:hypothetical protein
MSQFREAIKRVLPDFVRHAVINVRDALAAPPLEDILLHEYLMDIDIDRQPRFTLVIPSVSPQKAFGGVTTALEVFLEICKRTGADARILLDEFHHGVDPSVVTKFARKVGLDSARIDIVARDGPTPRVGVRASDVFMTFNWAITLNIQSLIRKQSEAFNRSPSPIIYIIQDYEPLFYRLSSTHMLARAAFATRNPCWGLFNSVELYDFFQAQGHHVEKAYVFDPKLSADLKGFLKGEAPIKATRILVYGRPSIPRNCYPAVVKGLRRWVARYPGQSAWDVVSAGLPHPPVLLGAARSMRSLGMLPLGSYGDLLRTTAVGLSLMASPHPSYPPLEMAHFGLRTITNGYANKDLSRSHSNIVSIPEVDPDTIADALGAACAAFEADPSAGWGRATLRPSFLEEQPFPFLDVLAEDLRRDVWGDGR